MTLRVKDTYLSAVIHGDIGMHRAKSLLQGDVLGQIIVVGEGNAGRDEDGDGKKEPGRSSGDYTHCFFVTRPPDPEAEVEIVRMDEKTGRKIYKVKDRNKSGLKCHATWPCVKEEPIDWDWDSDYFELWRVREISRHYWGAGKQVPPEVWRIIKWARDRRGKIYNWLQFMTFGLLHLPNSWVCSHYIFDGCFESTQHDTHPIILSPDGMFDQLATPNDLINSGKMIRIRYDGAREVPVL